MLKISKELVDRLAGRLLYGENIEKDIIPLFSVENKDLVDYHSILAKRILSYHFGEDGENRDPEDVYTFIRKEIFITTVTNFVSNLTIVLLNQTTEIEFVDIIYSKEDKDNYYFKIVME